MKIWGLIPAAGAGERMGAKKPKQFLDIDGVPVIARSLKALFDSGMIEGIVVPTKAEYMAELEDIIKHFLPPDARVEIVKGGATRQDSVYNGLVAIERVGAELVVIHDAARPFVTPEIIREAIRDAADAGAAAVGIPATDTTVITDGSFIVEYLPRDRLARVQTPQVFLYDIIKSAHEKARDEGYAGALDDSELVVRSGHPVRVLMGSPSNVKITYPSDIARAKMLNEQKG